MTLRNLLLPRVCSPRDRARRWVLAGALLLAAIPGFAQTVAQQGPNPIPFSTTGSIDNRMVLTAASAQHPSSMTVQVYDVVKYAWIMGLGTGQYLTWSVNVDQGGLYDATLMVDTGVANQTFGLSVDGGAPASFTVASSSWTRANAGKITLPTGVHTITLTTAGPGSASVKGLELLPDVDAAAYATRVTAYKASTAHFSSYDYGLMFQYGAWGFPANGGAALPINQQAANFNVASFVSMVKSTGAKYVIWSTTWYTYQMDAPNAAVNSIVGETNRTATTDLIGNVATALAAQGIDFYLYYHSGSDTQAPGGYDSTDWWQAQNWPATWSPAGWGNRSTFFTNWTNVVSTLGTRYGSALKGWFFDDGGMLYYGGPFESLSVAARAGNPSRLLSYNGWVLSNITDFEDVAFGEVCNAGGAPVGGTGQITSGPETSLQGHCMYPMENDWGIHYQGQTIGATNYTVQSAVALVLNNSLRAVPTSFNMMMYQDGTVSPTSLSVLQGLAAYRGSYGCGGGCTQLDDTSLALNYSPGWQVSSNRGAGDFQDGVHFATTNGSSVSLPFTGNGISVFMPTNSDEGTFQVQIDGVSQGTYSANGSSSYTPRVLVYSNASLSNGPHTLTLVKLSGTYLVLDYIQYLTPQATSTAPSFTLAPAATSLSLAQNLGGEINVNVTPVNGFSGTVNFSVTGLPAGASSVFEPGSSTSGTTLIVFVPAGVAAGTYPLTITGTSGTATATTNLSLSVTAQAAFTLGAAASTVSLTPGHSATDALTMTPVGGFTGTASFSASGLPAGVTASFSPASSATGTSLGLTASASAAAGTYPITITASVAGTGSSNAFTETTTVTLVIASATSPNFTLAVSPAQQTVIHGGVTGATVAVTLTPTNGFNGTVNYSVSGVPANLSNAFLPNGAGATFVLYAQAAAVPGTYALTITGTSGSVTASVPLTVVIQ
jgi:hypothetical protein